MNTIILNNPALGPGHRLWKRKSLLLFTPLPCKVQ
jgi:hypothetical protein